eukprot:6078282-Ditylum_brightwellii.AAC.1
MDTAQCNIHPVYGNTKRRILPLVSSLMTLVSNTPAAMMWTNSYQHFASCIKSLLTGMENYLG